MCLVPCSHTGTPLIRRLSPLLHGFLDSTQRHWLQQSPRCIGWPLSCQGSPSSWPQGCWRSCSCALTSPSGCGCLQPSHKARQYICPIWYTCYSSQCCSSTRIMSMQQCVSKPRLIEHCVPCRLSESIFSSGSADTDAEHSRSIRPQPVAGSVWCTTGHLSQGRARRLCTLRGPNCEVIPAASQYFDLPGTNSTC